MADIVMPQLGESVTEGTITRWFKSIGDSVTEDEPLFEVSTDKVDTEVPSPASGVLSEIRVPEGDTVDVGTVLAVLGDAADAGAGAGATAAPADAPTPEPAPEADVAPPAPTPEPPPAPAAPVAPTPPTPAPAPAAPAPAAPAPAAPAPAAPAAAAPVAATAASGVMLSPLVRRLVDEHRIDPATIKGTGVGGRITREDVLDAVDARGSAAPSSASAPAAAPVSSAPAPVSPPRSVPARPNAAPMRPGSGDTVEPLNKIRKFTGDHMVMSKSTSPHAITMVEVDYEAVERVRRTTRSQFMEEEGFALTYLPFVSRAVVDALHEFPHMNASVADGSLVLHNEVHLAIAVDLDYEGLLAPVIADAHERRLRAIAREISDLASRARSRQLGPDELTGGTFTISNSGSYGTAMVIPIINQPQVAILSTDGVSRKPVVVVDQFGNETIGIHSVGNLTLSWDHRAFDGAYSAAFMARLKEIIETRDWAAEL